MHGTTSIFNFSRPGLSMCSNLNYMVVPFVFDHFCLDAHTGPATLRDSPSFTSNVPDHTTTTTRIGILRHFNIHTVYQATLPDIHWQNGLILTGILHVYTSLQITLLSKRQNTTLQEATVHTLLMLIFNAINASIASR